MAGTTQKVTKTKTIKTGLVVRAAQIVARADTGEGDSDDRRVDLVFSSEEPADQPFGREILDHGKGAVRMGRLASGRAPLLVDHDRRDQIGVVETAKIDGSAKVGRATVRLGRGARAAEILQDVRDGIRTNVSVSYRIHKMVLAEAGDDRDTFRVVDWEPLEISIVSVPADATVGVGRGNAEDFETIIEERTKPMDKDEQPPEAPEGTRDDKPAKPDAGRSIKTDDVAERAAIKSDKSPAEAATEAVRAERARIAEIEEIGRAFEMKDETAKAIRDGASVEQFRKIVMDAIGKRSPASRVPASETLDVGLTDQEVRNYSLLRAIRALAYGDKNPRFREEAAFEFEASRAVSARMGTEPAGVYVPVEVLRDPRFLDMRNGSRDLNVGTGTAGGNLVASNLLVGSFIDLLRNRSITGQTGANILPDLVGNVPIPKQTGGATAAWISTEGGDATESEASFGLVELSPKDLGAFTDLTRRLIMQSSIGIENLVRNDLITALALAMDLATHYGSGSSGQPRGIGNTSGINTKTFSAADPTYAEIVEMESLVDADNALDGMLSYVMDAAMRGALKTTDKFSGSGNPVWEAGNTVNGYRGVVSNQITDGDVFFGNYSDLLIGLWGGLDINVDTATLSKSGGVRIVALQSGDVAVRHAESFCLGNDTA